jgi:hypothetical protein
VLLADLHHVDGPSESRLVRVRRVTTADEHAPRGIEPALDVVVHVLAAHDSSPLEISIEEARGNVQFASDSLRRHYRTLGHRVVVYRVRVNAALGVVFLLSGSAALVYGLLDIVAPSFTIRWQVRSTATNGGTRQAVGMGFQRVLGIDPESDPWDDPGVRRKLRWIGLALSLLGLAVVALGAWILTSG